MKKLAAILITVLMVAVLTTPLFAFDTGFDRRNYSRTRHCQAKRA